MPKPDKTDSGGGGGGKPDKGTGGGGGGGGKPDKGKGGGGETTDPTPTDPVDPTPDPEPPAPEPPTGSNDVWSKADRASAQRTVREMAGGGVFGADEVTDEDVSAPLAAQRSVFDASTHSIGKVFETVGFNNPIFGSSTRKTRKSTR